MLGAAIVLPDHPQIAPQSRGNLFDNTEIEEALLLHVHSLTDEERERRARTRPSGRCSTGRWRWAGDEIIGLHGGLKEVSSLGGSEAAPLGRSTTTPVSSA